MQRRNCDSSLKKWFEGKNVHKSEEAAFETLVFIWRHNDVACEISFAFKLVTLVAWLSLIHFLPTTYCNLIARVTSWNTLFWFDTSLVIRSRKPLIVCALKSGLHHNSCGVRVCHTQRRNEGVKGGRNPPGVESLSGRRKFLTVSPVLPSTADLLPKDRRFEHEAPNLFLAPGDI